MFNNIPDLFISKYSRQLLKKLEQLDPRLSQEKTLLELVKKASNTKFGKDHGFSSIRTIEDFQSRVPIRNYEDFWQKYWKESFPHTGGNSWPERIPYFGLSSGTTTGDTKYLPLSMDMLKSNQKAALTLQGRFYELNPQAKLYDGKFLFLGGSTNLNELAPNIYSGDLSGIVSNEAPGWLKRFTLPPKEIALMSDWERKLEVMVGEALKINITGISGVPSWVLLLLAEAKKQSGKERIAEIWPGLKLIIHGGIKFEPYRKAFENEFDGSYVTFLETYPASEGFISFEDLKYNKLRLMLGHNVFHEFVPVHELENENPTRHTIKNAVVGEQYALVMTTCSGLWSYLIGDTICFESLDPPLIRFTGRTKYFLSAFGEHLISEEIENAVSTAAMELNLQVNDFHVGPIFPEKSDDVGYHQYLIEYKGDAGSESFARAIDEKLCKANADYEAHRRDDLSMLMPKIIRLKPGAYRDWMASKGKLGGQHKVPRMDNSGKLTEEILDWMLKNEKANVNF